MAFLGLFFDWMIRFMMPNQYVKNFQGVSKKGWFKSTTFFDFLKFFLFHKINALEKKANFKMDVSINHPLCYTFFVDKQRHYEPLAPRHAGIEDDRIY